MSAGVTSRGPTTVAHQSRSRSMAALLTGTAFTGTFIAVIAGNPHSALAACNVTVGPNTVTCDDTVLIPPGHLFNFATGSVTATILNGATVTGGVFGGLVITTAEQGAAIDVTNNGTVTSAGSSAALHLQAAQNGNVSYTGNGTLTNTFGPALYLYTLANGTLNVGSSATPVTPTWSGGTGALQMSGDQGAVNVFLHGGSLTTSNFNSYGIGISTTSGPIGIRLTGNTAITQTYGAGNMAYGVHATTTSGAITISSDANIGAAGAALLVGIRAVHGNGAGDISLTQTGGTIFATSTGINVHAPGSGSASITTAAGSAITMTGGTGASVSMVGTGAASLTLDGTISGAAAGAVGAITNAANTHDITIAINGSISASSTGLETNNTGSGGTNVTVGSGAVVQGGTYGVSFASGTTKTLTNSGAISGGTGVRTTSGATTITNYGSITGTGTNAVQLGGANNLFVMSGPNATLTGNAVGSGTDTFRLAGAGSNTFNASQIGAGWTLLDKTGSSNWTLTGTSTYAGAVTVSAGTLSVNGNLASASGVTVNSGATLGGSGTLPSLTVGSGGVLAPGNSIGTLNVAGAVTFGAGSTYRVEANAAGQSDRIIASGTAALNGAVQVVAQPGSYGLSTSYTILQAANVTGTFSGVTSDLAFLTASLAYAPTAVTLTLTRNDVSFASVGATPNQRAVGGAFDASGAGNPLASLVFPLSAAQARAAFDQLSGEVHASTVGTLANDSLAMRSAILGRLRQASFGDGEMASMAALSLGGPQTAFADGAMESALAYAKSPIVTKAPMAAPRSASDAVFWAQGFGAWGRFDGDGNATSVRRDLAGFITGVDARAGSNGRLGIAAGYTGTRNAGRGSSTVDTAHIAGYGGWGFGNVNLRAGGAYAFHAIDTDRMVNVPGFTDRLTSRTDGSTGQLFGEVGYGVAMGRIAFEPFAGGAWVRVHTDGAAERGGLAALNVAAQTFETAYSTVGMRAASIVPLANDMILIPRATVAWQHAFNDVTPSATLAFQTAPATAFTISGAPIARDSLLAEAGLDLAISRNITVGLSYVGQVGNAVADHAAKGKFSWAF